jgi:hypothetical protein
MTTNNDMTATIQDHFGSKPAGRWLTVRPNGRVNIHGIDLPNGTKLLSINEDSIAIKVPGHTYWTGMHMPHAYASPETQVFAIVGRDENADRRSGGSRTYEVAGLITISNARKGASK